MKKLMTILLAAALISATAMLASCEDTDDKETDGTTTEQPADSSTAEEDSEPAGSSSAEEDGEPADSSSVEEDAEPADSSSAADEEAPADSSEAV